MPMPTEQLGNSHKKRQCSIFLLFQSSRKKVWSVYSTGIHSQGFFLKHERDFNYFNQLLVKASFIPSTWMLPQTHRCLSVCMVLYKQDWSFRRTLWHQQSLKSCTVTAARALPVETWWDDISTLQFDVSWSDPRTVPLINDLLIFFNQWNIHFLKLYISLAADDMDSRLWVSSPQ